MFGGTFDPPHIGHMALLQNAINAVQPGRVLVVPAGTPPHKKASATPANLRLAMCACFAPLFSGLELCELEIHRPGLSYTLDTVNSLRAQCPGAAFYLSIGGDLLPGFTAWRQYKQLLNLVTLVVQSREVGKEELEKAARTLSAKGGRILWAGGETPAISSTEIRAGIGAGRDMRAFLPPPVWRIVRENGLYT